jgi:ATP-dependent RNA helicase RhlE
MAQRLVSLRAVEIFVLDEADRMLDMGFIHDIRRVIAEIPRERQTLFFSATMPSDILRLADAILTDPVKVAVDRVATPAEMVEHGIYFVEKQNKPDLLKHLLAEASIKNALIFTRTKHGADRVTRQLERANIPAEAIHGDKSQGARERALENFKKGRTRVLVATDIAARGLDIVELSHVINFDLPNEPESYVHRIGRTGRAGASGTALSFCDFSERPFLAEIERLIRKRLTVVDDHPCRSFLPPGPPTKLAGEQPDRPRSPFLLSTEVLFRKAADRRDADRTAERKKEFRAAAGDGASRSGR